MNQKALQERSYRILRGMYDALEVGVPTEYGDGRLAKTIGLTKAVVSDHRRVFSDRGIVTVGIHHGSVGAGKARRSGTWATWTLNMDLPAAYRALDKHFADGGPVVMRVLNPGSRPKSNGIVNPTWAENTHAAMQETVTIGTVETGETIAIAGPEPKQPLAALAPARKDEGAALIEAARQYTERDKTVLAAIKAIEDLGITVDHEAIIAAVKLPVDERLAAVALVIPYVTQLQNERDRLNREANKYVLELRELRKEVEPLRREVNSLKSAQRRLVEERVRASVSGTSAQHV